jgi:hypothetical protein
MVNIYDPDCPALEEKVQTDKRKQDSLKENN